MSRKILLITYHYPPSTAVGGLRLANFARYLPAHGWKPYVLTIQDRYLDQMDAGRLRGLDHAPVFKTCKLPTISSIYLKFKALITHRSSNGNTIAERPISRTEGRDTKDTTGETLKQRLKRYLFSLVLCFPDGERNWVIPAVVRGVRIIRHEKIDCIVTSCPPYSVHLIGLILKWITRVRWVADFRDPWITGSQKRLYFTSRLSMALEGQLEKQVLRRADSVLVNTVRLSNLLRQVHPAIGGRKLIHLPNGFNPEKFIAYHGLEKYDRFTIAYAGSLYFGRSPEPVFKSLHTLIADRTIRRETVCVKLVGHCNQIDGRPIESVIRQYDLEDVVEVSPPVPYGEAMEIIARSHLALLLAPDQPFQVPAKAYDYFGTGTRILALAGDGATADVIRDTGMGGVFPPDDIKTISSFLTDAIMNRKDSLASGGQRALNKLDIRFIVNQLADCIGSVCDEEKSSRQQPCSPSLVCKEKDL